MTDTLTQAPKPRIRSVDLLKAMAIILVIAGHTYFANAGVKAWIHSFHMPLFFFASGMTQTARQTFSGALDAVRKSFLRLMIPYFVWAMIYAQLTYGNLLRIAYGSHEMLNRAGSLTYLWFLPALFVAITLFQFAGCLFKKYWNAPVKLLFAAASFLLAAILPKLPYDYPWGVSQAFYALGFILLGNLVMPIVTRSRERLPGKPRQALVWAGIGAAAGALSVFLYRFNLPDGNSISTAHSEYGRFYLFVPIALCGILLLLSLSILLDLVLNEKAAKPLCYIGQNTMALFVTQKPIISLFGYVFSKFPLPDPVELILTCVFTTLIGCMIAFILNRFLPAILGKTDRRSA